MDEPLKAVPPADPNIQRVELVSIDDAHAGQRIDNFLISKLKGVPKSHIYRILRSGEVRVNKGRIDQTYRLIEGDVVRVPPVRLATPKEANTSKDAAFGAKMAGNARPAWDLLFEDDALIAIDKPAGLAVHGGSGISKGVIESLREQRPAAKFLELVHRLDRDTSGVLLIAKKRSALVALHAMLRGDHPESARIEKHYLALVDGEWPHAKKSVRIRLSKYVTREGERRVAVDEEDGQESHTIFTRLEAMSGCTLLDCDIRTGRTHQIRVHLASLGYPIIGDDKYGDFALNKRVAIAAHGGFKRMFLHAHRIAFAHPISGEALRIEAPLTGRAGKSLERYLQHRRAVR